MQANSRADALKQNGGAVAGTAETKINGDNSASDGGRSKWNLKESCHAAHRVQVQIAVQMAVNMIQHSLYSGMVVIERSRHRPHPLW